MSNIAMIPARMGSERLRLKNLALLNGRPLISYAIEAAKESGVFDRIVINSDGKIFKEVADRHGVEFYLRPNELGSSETKSDDVVNDFMRKFPSNCLAWVNPISPLQTSYEIQRIVEFFEDQALDSLITVIDEQVHCVYQGEPLNFEVTELFAKTQDLIPIQSFVYSVMMWRSRTFLEEFDKNGFALLSGKLGYFPVSKESSVIIKTDEDLLMADNILKAREGAATYEVKYDILADKL